MFFSLTLTLSPGCTPFSCKCLYMCQQQLFMFSRNLREFGCVVVFCRLLAGSTNMSPMSQTPNYSTHTPGIFFFHSDTEHERRDFSIVPRPFVKSPFHLVAIASIHVFFVHVPKCTYVMQPDFKHELNIAPVFSIINTYILCECTQNRILPLTKHNLRCNPLFKEHFCWNVFSNFMLFGNEWNSLERLFCSVAHLATSHFLCPLFVLFFFLSTMA